MAKRKLVDYRAKRDFSKTAEPSGADVVTPSRALRFVVQKHAASHLHYDFRLEMDSVFKSWAVAKGPSVDAAVRRLAAEVEDHPLDYGDFEGTIPKGQYGGGTVMLWDRGFWQPDGDARALYAKGDLKFVLAGEKMKGGWVLVRMKNDKYKRKLPNWLLIKHHDEFEEPGSPDALLELDHSVASGRSMDDIAAGKGASPNRSCARCTSNAMRYGIPIAPMPPIRSGGRKRQAGAKPSSSCHRSCRRCYANWSIGRPKGPIGCMK